MTAGAVANRHEAAVLDGAVRDLVEIKRDYDFPVYARSVSPGTTLGRFKTLASNVEVEVGGVLVNPGDIIVADIDGVVEQIEPNRTGFLVPTGDTNHLVRLVNDVLGSRGRLAAIGAAARESVNAHWSLERFVDRHERLYREVLAGARKVS